MDLVKQYIIQSISAASNNLRLSTQKIEVVALLRETILKSNDLEADIKKMKKVTELSTLAIRLSEIHNYLTQGVIDFFKISEKFKEHSQYLIKDLSHMLEMVNPLSFKQALDKINPRIDEPIVEGEFSEEKNGEISIDFSKRNSEPFENPGTKEVKEELILEEEDEENDSFFKDFEELILKPIKPIDLMLKNFDENNIDTEELLEYVALMKQNAEASEKVGFEILTNMHEIISISLKMIVDKNVKPTNEIIESIRSCLIVIVAVVRGKEIDITSYLNKAEDFGKQLKLLKKG